MKKGFTLIELLAVFVILAIIATIAIPIVQNLTSNSKKEGALRSAELYINAVDQALIDKNLNDGSYAVKDGNICLDETCTQVMEIDLKNNKPESGYINIRYLAVSYVTDLKFNKYYISTLNISSTTDNSLIATLSPSGKAKLYKSGDIVYFDVVNGTSCTNYTSDNSLSGYNGLSATKTKSSQNGCLKFYAFLDTGGDKINLILDHNLASEMPNEDNSNKIGPSGALNSLASLTDSWKGTLSLKNYTYSSNAGSSSAGSYDAIEYELNYSSMKARFITANEVAKLGNISGFDETTYDGYGKSVFLNVKGLSTAEITNDLGWLLDNVSKSNSTTSYYTSAAVHDSYASYWIVSATSGGSLTYGPSRRVSASTLKDCEYGIRPVIEVSKSKLG